MAVKCANCSYSCENYEKYLFHISLHIRSHEEIICPFNCGQNYANKKSFLIHLSRNHPLKPFEATLPLQTTVTPILATSEDDIENTTKEENDLKKKFFEFQETLKNRLKLNNKQKKLMSTEWINFIIKNDYSKDDFKQLIPFAKSDYLQTKYLQKNYFIPQPKDLKFGDDHVYYISLKDSISYQFRCPKFQKIFFENSDAVRTANRTIISGFRDGRQFQNYDLNTVLVQLYFDDLCLSNPIGYARTKMKIFAAYYSIQNFPYKFSTKRKDINLLMLSKRDTIKKFTKENVLDIMITEINELKEKGIKVKVNNKMVNLKFDISSIVGDNKGIHELFGLSESFNSGSICRFCYARYRDIQILHSLDHFIPRTTESYHQDLSKINKSRTPDLVRKRLGIVGQNIFDRIKNFDSFSKTVPDLLHDIFAGVDKKIVEAILKNTDITSYSFENFIEINKLGITFNKEKFQIGGKAMEV